VDGVKPNEAKLLKEQVAAFLVKSENLLESDSAIIMQVVERALNEYKHVTMKYQARLGMLRRFVIRPIVREVCISNRFKRVALCLQQ
jgi:hypothetical protein